MSLSVWKLLTSKKSATWFALLAIALVAVLPAVTPDYYLSAYNFTFLAVVGAIGLNLLTGLAGQVSIGTAAFLAIGGFFSAFLSRSFGVGLLIGVPLSGIAAAFVGLLIGLPSLRFRGFYLVLTTLALHFIVLFVAYQYQVNALGLEGLPLPVQRLGPITLGSELDWYFLLAPAAIITVIASANISRSKLGRAWIAVRDHDTAAAMIGIDVVRHKLLAFAFSSFLIGIAGSLAAYHLGNVSVDSYTLTLGVQYVAMIIIGGMGSTAGAVLGAIFVTQESYVIQAIVNALPFQNLTLSVFPIEGGVFGLIIIAFLLFEPRGLIAIWRRIKALINLRVTMWEAANTSGVSA
jgi:branched-chain amino acid transport system permease protein